MCVCAHTHVHHRTARLLRDRSHRCRSIYLIDDVDLSICLFIHIIYVCMHIKRTSTLKLTHLSIHINDVKIRGPSQRPDAQMVGSTSAGCANGAYLDYTLWRSGAERRRPEGKHSAELPTGGVAAAVVTGWTSCSAGGRRTQPPAVGTRKSKKREQCVPARHIHIHTHAHKQTQRLVRGPEGTEVAQAESAQRKAHRRGIREGT